VIARAGNRCEGCGSGDVSLEVHHVRPIQRGWPELPPLRELVVLCRRCHVDAQRK
jgi:5-methylcytosine-specific restriction endonuclease McrA